MTEITLQIEDSLAAVVGRDKVEQFLKDMVAQLHLKAAASDALESLADININDPQWKQARDRAWDKYVAQENSWWIMC